MNEFGHEPVLGAHVRRVQAKLRADAVQGGSRTCTDRLETCDDHEVDGNALLLHPPQSGPQIGGRITSGSKKSTMTRRIRVAEGEVDIGVAPEVMAAFDRRQSRIA